MNDKRSRVAILDGARTPFVKAGTNLAKYSMQELGVIALKGLVEKSKIDPKEIEEFIFSTVLLDPRTPNWAREILFSAGLPKTINCHSVSNNCISGLLATSVLSNQIALGQTQLGIAGGSESMSNPTLLFRNRSNRKFLELFRSRSAGEKVKRILGLRPKDFAPQPPAITEPSTGLTMGQHMELTTKELSIPREEQDRLALASHLNAARATADGFYAEDIVMTNGVSKDLLVRGDTSYEKLAKLRPVFDRSEKGTLTAGNSSPLTDGASVVMLASEEKAKSLGREPLAFIRDFEFAGIDPNKGLLMAPAVAVSKLLKRNGLGFGDFDRIEIHEAFAAQVLANIKAWENGLFGSDNFGKFPMEKLNLDGGSIALGHPFAATGGRMISALARSLKRNNQKLGLISICAAGAMAGALIIER